MRILVTIPHFYHSAGALTPDGREHGSVGPRAESRLAALSACIASLHQHFGPAQHVIDQATRVALPANLRTSSQLDVAVCTTGENHLLDRLRLPAGSYRWHPTNCSPALLGFECHAASVVRPAKIDAAVGHCTA